MRRIPLLLALLLMFVTVAPCDTVFSNLVQPGNQFGPDAVGVGAIPVPATFLYSATNFMAAFDARVTELEIPLLVVSGAPEVDVFLYADSGNLPGAVLESFHLTNVSTIAPISLNSIASSSHPVLLSGQQYWVGVTGGSPSTYALWGLTLFAGDPSAGGAVRIIQDGTDEGWIRQPGTRVGALVVNGDPVSEVPEPATSMVLGAGLLGIVRIMRRKTH